MNVLASDPQGFTACCQDVNLRRFLEDGFCQRRSRLNHTLAAIEHQQNSDVSQCGQKAGDRIAIVNGKSERRADRTRHEMRIRK